MIRSPSPASLLAILGGLAALYGAPQDLRAAHGAGPAFQDPAATAATTPDPWPAASAVLRKRCLSCHGGEQVKGHLRFATAATLAKGGSRGPVVDRGNLERSRILHVISYKDPELAMPPTGQLPAEEVEVLRTWVLAGAVWPEGEAGQLADPEQVPDEVNRMDPVEGARWWAYGPLVEPVLPAAREGAAEHPVDALLRARREAAGLAAAPEADPRTLVRRASFALTGLPPQPAEVESFVAAHLRDPAAAWSELVDRLLASPHHGEHWGRHWLDQVRYAETNGYERDGTKPNIWRYRDWVIEAINADMPYDRFVTEQLAGDELAAAGLSDDPAASRIATGYFRLNVWDDEPSDRAQARADEIADIVDTTGQVFLATTMGCARCHDHKADPVTARDYYAMTAWFNNIHGYEGGRTKEIADAPEPGQMTVPERDDKVAAVDARIEPILRELRIAVQGRDTPLPVALVHDARSKPQEWRYVRDAGAEGWHTPGFDDSKWRKGKAGFGAKGTPGSIVGTDWHQKEIRMRTRFRLEEIPEALVLSIHYDDDPVVYLNGVEVFRAKGYVTEYKEIQLPQEALSALVVGSNVIAVASTQDFGGQYIDVGLRTGWLGDFAETWRQRLSMEGAKFLSKERLDAGLALLAERQRLLEAPVAKPFPALVVAERGPRAPAQHVLQRGSAHAPGEVVAPAVPAVFAVTAGGQAAAPAEVQGDAESTGRRLAFARWLTTDGSFLTARVMANRTWQFLFGRGLCRSPGDFGRLGELPTHPELLDHLALRVIAMGWSQKQLIRYLMTSKAWRMSSEGRPEDLDRDPRNDLYWRFDPRRLRAEEFRDAVLAVSGQLNPGLHGPSVYPPLAEEVLATASRPNEAWRRSTPEDAVRRSIYVHVKRSLRVPLLEGLDQPSPDMPCPERFPTNVPTQSLMTLNGAFTNDSAAVLAKRLRDEGSDLAQRVDRGIRLALGRLPAPGEVARHERFVREQMTKQGLDEAGALQLFALVLFNLNEFLWVD